MSQKSNNNLKDNVYLDGYTDAGTRNNQPAPPNIVTSYPIIVNRIVKPKTIVREQPIGTLNTFFDGDLISPDTFDTPPILETSLTLLVSGIVVIPANGPAQVSTSVWYITDVTDTIVRATGEQQVGDRFHWNGSIAGMQLETTVDTLVLLYEIAAP